jgi:hypothetical protein
MSRVHQQNGYVFYNENDHDPMHVHIFRGSFTGPEIEINLIDMSIRDNHMNASDTRKALRLCKENQDFLIQEWLRISPKL